MIRIYKEKNPAGDWWMEYTEMRDGALVEHILAGMGWKPTLEGAARFLRVAHAHGAIVECPPELLEAAG